MFSLTAFRQEIPSRTYWMAVAVAAAGVALLWCVLTYGGYVAPIFLPSPTDVWNAAAELCLSGVFAADFGRSCERVFGGFVAAIIVSIPIGILMGRFSHHRSGDRAVSRVRALHARTGVHSPHHSLRGHR